ncbi:MAG: hypothetical protein ACRD5I_12030 [Candidatus Acidiferrales bacterium]
MEKLLDETLTEVQAGRMKPGQAYAVGYLAQLMLMARESRRKEVKLDVKWYWDMVDLVVTMDDAKKSLKEKARNAREEKKAKKAREAEEEDKADEREEAEDEEETELEENGQEAAESGSVADFREERKAGPSTSSRLHRDSAQDDSAEDRQGELR